MTRYVDLKGQNLLVCTQHSNIFNFSSFLLSNPCNTLFTHVLPTLCRAQHVGQYTSKEDGWGNHLLLFLWPWSIHNSFPFRLMKPFTRQGAALRKNSAERETLTQKTLGDNLKNISQVWIDRLHSRFIYLPLYLSPLPSCISL